MSGVYLDKFGLREAPFRLTPDPKYLYRGQQYERVLAELRYGIEQRKGFMVLTGEVGTGKTTICRALLGTLAGGTRTALILNPTLSTRELLRTIIQDFGLTELPVSASKKELMDYLNGFLLRVALDGENALLIVDEAQNLSAELLEELRMLSNLETEREKLLQILLIGQPELTEKLSSRKLRQLKQRVAVWTNLAPMKLKDSSAYILRRLTVASRGSLLVSFTNGAFKKLQQLSGGYPRTINLICDRTLIAAYGMDIERIGAGIVRTAAKEVRSGSGRTRRSLIGLASAAGLVVAFLLFTFLPLVVDRGGRQPAEAVTDKKMSMGSSASDTQAQGQVPRILSKYFSLAGLDYLGKEALLWRVSGARVEDLALSLRALDIDRQFGIKTAVVPVNEDLWRKSGTVGLVRGARGEDLFLILPSRETDGAWRVIASGGEEQFVQDEDLDNTVRGPGALVLYRSLTGLDRALARGDRGASVYALQDYLSRAGVLKRMSVDGIFGGKTERALTRLQNMWGIEPTGRFDTRTSYFMSAMALRERG